MITARKVFEMLGKVCLAVALAGVFSIVVISLLR